MADSRPLPGPCTRPCTRRPPSVTASRPACSPATVAANGVDFLDPLKPALPDEPHEIVFPCESVIVMVVLLKVADTWAIPSASITLFAFFPIAIELLCHLLLAGDCAAWTLLGAGVGVRALTTDGEAAAVTNAAVAADVHEPLDVHRDFGAQRTFDAEVLLDRLTKPLCVGVVQIANPLLGVDAGGSEDTAGGRATDAGNVREAGLSLFLSRESDAGDTRPLTLPLFVPWSALAGDAGPALSLFDLRVVADRLNAASNLHVLFPT